MNLLNKVEGEKEAEMEHIRGTRLVNIKFLEVCVGDGVMTLTLTQSKKPYDI